MRKTILYLSFYFISISSYAQFSESVADPDDTYYTDGQVGIGLNNPTSKLDIRLGSNFYYTDESGLRLTYPIPTIGTGTLVNENIFEIRQNTLGSSFSSKMVVDVNGNVGIGLADPTYKLHLVNKSITSGTAFRADAINGHIRLFETDGTNPGTDFTQIERNADAFHIYQRDASSYQHVLTAEMDGKVGLGTASPTAGLHVKNNQSSSVLIETVGDNNADLVFQSGNDQSDIIFKDATGSLNSLLRFYEDSDGPTLSYQNRQGTPEEYLRISGKGIVYAKEIVVQATPFPDYVFEEDYELMSLKEVEDYISAEGHLPNVPSAAEVETDGMAVGDMQVLQMEKIEELYLHVIELNKKLESMAAENAELKEALETNNETRD